MIDKLHDATLLSVDFTWESGLLKLFFIPCGSDSKQRVIFAEDTVYFNITRHFPWGKSVSINKVIYEQDAKYQRLNIEMQSGDFLKIKASSIIEKPK